ncbi:hypothetical protein, partial [Klebsiella pneumoniae]|uniref:hypothetical protein n=1 Tax=Klebsiella pneumoniae TaxID=573 RepID=UPI003D36D73C
MSMGAVLEPPPSAFEDPEPPLEELRGAAGLPVRSGPEGAGVTGSTVSKAAVESSAESSWARSPEAAELAGLASAPVGPETSPFRKGRMPG